jgi:hypothetical protein
VAADDSFPADSVAEHSAADDLSPAPAGYDCPAALGDLDFHCAAVAPNGSARDDSCQDDSFPGGYLVKADSYPDGSAVPRADDHCEPAVQTDGCCRAGCYQAGCPDDYSPVDC